MSARAKTVAILTAKPGREAALEALLRALAAASRAEPGNLHWQIWRDREDARRFVLDELYRDDAAVAAHQATPHFQDYRARIGDLAERLAITCHAVDAD